MKNRNNYSLNFIPCLLIFLSKFRVADKNTFFISNTFSKSRTSESWEIAENFPLFYSGILWSDGYFYVSLTDTKRLIKTDYLNYIFEKVKMLRELINPRKRENLIYSDILRTAYIFYKTISF